MTMEFRYVITSAYQPVSTVTNAVGNGTSITYTASNSFAVGQAVTTTGISPSQYNKSGYVITARSSTNFTVASTSTGTFVSGGSAVVPNPIIAEIPFTSVNFTQQLNSIGTFQGEVLLSGINSTDLNVYGSTIPGQSILWILFSDLPTFGGIPVWSGIIWNREYDSESQTLHITAQEMMSLYQRRRIATTKTYTAQDPTAIAYSLLQYTEARSYGNTGLTYNSVTSGLSTTRTYNGYEYKTVYQAIKDLASGYFDFKIQPSVVTGTLVNKFTIGIPLGTVYSTTSAIASVFQFPGNVISYNFPENGQGAANVLYGLGYGANGTKLVATAIDSSMYTSGFPLLEDSANYVDVGDASLLKAITLGQLNATSYPPTTVEIVVTPYADPEFTQYQIGDEVRLDIKDDYFPTGLNGFIMRIVGISVNPGENGPSRVTLTLTRQLSAGSVT